MAKPQAIVQSWILEKITAGELKPGDHIPHLALAQKLGVSNNPVIQVIRKLEGQGILDRAPDGESRVRVYSPEDIYGILSIREAIEAAAARFCAVNATDEEMAVIRFRFDRMIRAYHAGDYAPAEELAFHEAIVTSSHTPILRHMYESIMLIRETFTLRVGNRTAAELIAIHEPIMAALEQRDADAAEVVAREHVARTRREYLQSIPRPAPRKQLQSASST